MQALEPQKKMMSAPVKKEQAGAAVKDLPKELANIDLSGANPNDFDFEGDLSSIYINPDDIGLDNVQTI